MLDLVLKKSTKCYANLYLKKKDYKKEMVKNFEFLENLDGEEIDSEQRFRMLGMYK